MTNADVIKEKMTISDLTKWLETDNCRKCKARKICKEKYPDGVWASFDCKRLLSEWLKKDVEEVK